MSLFYKEDGDVAAAHVGLFIGLAFIVVIGLAMAFLPVYTVWSSGKAGQAELAQAEYNRQIIVRQAQAKLDAATLEAEAAVAHAKGVQESNAIIAGGLGGPEGYLRFLYIQMLADSPEKQIIYIPTEAGLPILEAGKR